MKALVQEKERAIELRKAGMSYRDILTHVHVAKSSLSLWFKDLPLTKSEKYALKRRKDRNISRGRIKVAGILSQKRLDREMVWLNEARAIFLKHKNDPLFHIGIALYWAEGSKRATQWGFTNSDEEMVLMMLVWLEKFANTPRSDLHFRLYIHRLYAHENCEAWWQKKLSVLPSQFGATTYKPTNRGVKKRQNYKGCIRIEVRRSKGLLLKMKFWQNMLVDSYLKQ